MKRRTTCNLRPMRPVRNIRSRSGWPFRWPTTVIQSVLNRLISVFEHTIQSLLDLFNTFLGFSYFFVEPGKKSVKGMHYFDQFMYSFKESINYVLIAIK